MQQSHWFHSDCPRSSLQFLLLPFIISRKFYEISSDFPENVLLIRSASERKRTIYFVSTGLASLLQNVDQEKFNASEVFCDALWQSTGVT